jgi:hypothetical protein
VSESLHEREHYRPDQGVNPLLLPVLVGLPAGTAVGTAWLLKTAYLGGWYWIILLPCLLAFVLGGMMHAAVALSHCRQPAIAALIGLSAGLLAYLGYFYFAMTNLLPNASLESLPDYIQWRMETDVDADVGRPARGGEPSVFRNWWAFVIELLFLVGVPLVMGRRRARQAYSSELGQWLERDEVRFRTGARDQIAAALDEGWLERFVAKNRPITTPQQTGACRVWIEYVKAPEVSPLDHDVYLTAVERPFRMWLSSLLLRDALDQVRLEPQECLALQPLFPALAGQLRTHHEELRDAPQTTPGLELAEAPTAAGEAAEVAHFEEIPDAERAQLFSGRHLLMSNVVAGIPLLGLAAGAGLVGLGYFLQQRGAGLPVVLSLYAGGVVLGVICFGVLAANPYAAEQIYCYRLLQRTIRGRAESIVDADDPDVLHIALTRRENWQKVKVETCTDAGLATFDEQTGEFLFEGDVERFRIPAGAVVDCRPEQLHNPIDKQTQYWFARCVVRVPSGTRELLMCRGVKSFEAQSDTKRHNAAIDLARRLSGRVS